MTKMVMLSAALVLGTATSVKFGLRNWNVPANNVIDLIPKLVDKQLDEYYDQQQDEFDEYTETLNIVYDDLLEILQECGLANEEDGFIKDFAYAMEALRSLVDRQYGNEHTFHEMIDEKMVVARDEDGVPLSVDWLPKLTPSEE